MAPRPLPPFSLNPVTLFGGTDSIAAARWSRFGDVTVLVPVSTGSTSSITDRLGYLGLRARLNITGLSAGEQLLQDVNNAFTAALEQEGLLAGRIAQALESLPDSVAIRKCAAAIAASAYGDTPAACLGKVTVGLSADDYRALRKSLELAREKADAHYLGVDLRFDRGDPTLAGDSTKEMTALQAGFAFGRRTLTADPEAVRVGVQGRLGVRYTNPRIRTDSVVWALDGGLGFESSRLVNALQEVRFSTGLDFRYSNRPDSVAERTQTDFLVLRAAVNIPLVGGTSVSVGYTAPLVGRISPALTVNFDWGLLLPTLPWSKSN